DDGLHGDGAAGDHVFAATLPARANNTIIEFYIEATDAGAHVRTWPAAARQLDNSFAQTANCLYQVDDSNYTDSQPIFRLIMTEIERAELAQIWANAAGSDAEMNGTFVSVDGISAEVRYLCGFRNRGHGTRTASPNNVRAGFRNDDKFHGARALNLNTQFTQDQVSGPQI